MKKMLFALLACATLAAPAMAADWSVTNAFYRPYGDYTDKADYTFYLYHDSTASITSTADMTNAIADMTLSEFTALAGTGYAFTVDRAWGMISVEGDLSAPLTTLSADPANIWGVCVYNGENAAFSVAETDADYVHMMGEWQYYSDSAAYTAFKPDSPATPEPATATLSLLALAGLATRRRRK